MINEIVKNIVSFTSGNSTFNFSTRKENNRFSGTWHTVFIEQITDMSDLGESEFKTVYKIACTTSPTEFAAINFAGKKYIKNFPGIDNKKYLNAKN